MKTKKAETSAGLSVTRQWLTLRVSADEKMRVEAQAALAGLSASEFMRRRIFGGRPVVAAADEAMLRELRRVGGLLKHYFVVLQKAGVNPEIIGLLESTLRLLARTVERIGKALGAARHDS